MEGAAPPRMEGEMGVGHSSVDVGGVGPELVIMERMEYELCLVVRSVVKMKR